MLLYIHTQTKAVAIRKSRAGVPEHTSTVQLLQELFSRFLCRNNMTLISLNIIPLSLV